MRKKRFKYGIYGLVIGCFLGAFLGVVALNQFKMSQRASAIPITVTIFSAFFMFWGYRIGDLYGKNIYIEERLGIDRLIENGFFKAGKYWVGQTKWKDLRNGDEYLLQTARSNQKFLVSALNGRVILKHDSTSASKVTIPKYHNLAKSYVFGRLKSSFDETPKEVEALFPTIS